MNNNPDQENKFCSNCGSIINQGDKFCHNCGYRTDEVKNVESNSFNKERNNILIKYKSGIIFFCVITFFILLFPPIEWGTRMVGGRFQVKHSGFYFLLSFLNTGREWGMGINEAHINILQLFIQIILVAILSVFFQYYNVQIIKWWKKNNF